MPVFARWPVIVIICIGTVATLDPVDKLPTFCDYLRCAVSGEDGAQTVTIRYDRTLWSDGNGTHREEFDFRAWNWTELNAFPDGAPIEVIFNGLDVMQIDTLYGNERVVSLNLDDNQIANVAREAFENFKRLTSLSLRKNSIKNIEALLHPYNELQYLDLTSNQIAKLDAFKLQALVSWPRLTHLNLSFNHIKTVTNQLGKLEQLVWLDLSNNKIHRDAKPIVLPGNIQELRMDSNQLTDWPFDGVPNSLKNLSLRFNELHSVKAASGVQRLDLSYNNLSDLEGDCFPSLEVLDLSSNFFTTLPLLSNTTEPWTLRKLTFSRMPNIQTIDRNFLSKATNLRDLKISICPKITHLEANLFTNLSALERLDLSYNGLQQIPEQLAHWGKIKHGVNLQGNPINCNCSMQWMLDRLIPEMKRHRELHHLFTRLRCVRPTIFHDQLLVHLTAYDNVLCRSTRELIGMEHVITVADESEKWIVIQKIVLAVLIVCIVIVACYLIYLKRKPRYTVVPKIMWTYKAGM